MPHKCDRNAESGLNIVAKAVLAQITIPLSRKRQGWLSKQKLIRPIRQLPHVDMELQANVQGCLSHLQNTSSDGSYNEWTQHLPGLG